MDEIEYHRCPGCDGMKPVDMYCYTPGCNQGYQPGDEIKALAIILLVAAAMLCLCAAAVWLT